MFGGISKGLSRSHVTSRYENIVAVRFISNKRGDHLTAYHISDKTKTNLPKNLLPQHLKSHYTVGPEGS